MGVEWTYTPTGIQILVEGFDATGDHASAKFKIYIKDPDVILSGASGGGTTPPSTGFTYTLPFILA